MPQLTVFSVSHRYFVHLLIGFDIYIYIDFYLGHYLWNLNLRRWTIQGAILSGALPGLQEKVIYNFRITTIMYSSELLVNFFWGRICDGGGKSYFFLQGLALTKVPKIKFVIIISGAKFRNESLAEKAYSSLIQCPSVHFLGIHTVQLLLTLHLLS